MKNENKRIYILEDSKVIGGLMKNSIESYLGFEAKNAELVADLFKLFQRNKPDLLVIDYYLGQHEKEYKTGLEVALHIRKTYGKIPVIFISGVRNPTIIEEIKSYNPIAFVHKDENSFFEIINELVKDTLS